MAQLGRLYEVVRNATTGVVHSGSSVAIYREGATVNGNQSGVTPLAVTVHHAGKILTGDTVFINSTTGTTYAATRTSSTVITLSGFAGTLNLTGGDRITPSSTQPTLYSDDQGAASTSNPLTTNSSGEASCWVEYGAYDLIVSGGGATTKAFTALVMPTQAIGQVRYADEFSGMPSTTTAGIQEAINDLPSTGGKVILSGNKTYSITAQISCATANVHIQGGGPSSLIVQGTNATGGIALAANGIVVSDLTLRGTDVSGANAHGINGGSNQDCTVERCVIEKWGKIGVNFANSSVRCFVRNNIIRDGWSEGIYFGTSTTDNVIEGNLIYNNDDNGIDCIGIRSIIANNIVKGNGTVGPGSDNHGIIIGASAAQTTTDVTVTGNVCQGNARSGIFVWGAGTSTTRITISGNTCNGNTQRGIDCQGNAGVTFGQLAITGNVCNGNSSHGILLDGVDDSVCNGNVVVGNGGHGIYTYATNKTCARNVVTGNIIRTSTSSGIRGDSGSVTDNMIFGNQIANNGTNVGTFSSATNMIYDNSLASGSLGKGADIASGATVTLGNDGDYFVITGTADITSITASWTGRRVTLQFSGTAAATGVTDGSNLALAGNFGYTPNDTLELRYDGTNWVELGRSVN